MQDFSYIIKSEETRQIDIDYQTAIAAKNTQEIAEVNAKLLKMQAAKSYAVLDQQKRTNQSLNEINETIHNLADGIENLNNNVDYLNDQIGSLKNEITDLKEEMIKGFKLIIDHLEEQQNQLEEIKDILSKPYETKLLELRKNANESLYFGIRDSGEDQKKYFEDSIDFLDECLKNPVGKKDYIVWFQKGWLFWKHTGDLDKAEESFSEARRLSKNKYDLYYLKSLRHLAYMQYLNNRLEKAYQTIQQAVEVSKDHDTLFDAARYAARNGYKKKALEYIDKCINMRPMTSLTMFAEEDFKC